MKNLDRDDIVKQTGFFNSFDGTPIYYEVRGSGRPIVMCYGVACLINHWTHQLRYFSRSYQTIVFDYRGHHKTQAPKDRSLLSFETTARDIAALLEHLSISKASFWGHSYGAQVLLNFYDLYPEAVENLVFVNGFAKNPLYGVLGGRPAEAAFQSFKEAYKKYPMLFAAAWKAAVLSPLTIPISSLIGGFNLSLTSLKDIEVYARGVASMDLEVFAILFEQMAKYDGVEVLEQIKVPTLIIGGKKDGVTPLEHQELMHRYIKNSQILRVPYGSHCTQLDLPDFVNLRIEKFLNEAGYGSKDGPAKKSGRVTAATSRKKVHRNS